MTLDPKIYRMAAELVVDKTYPWGCCGAIDESFHCWGEAWPHRDHFSNYFRPLISGRVPTYWFGDLTENHKLRRSLALLFMEQIAKDLMKEENE